MIKHALILFVSALIAVSLNAETAPTHSYEFRAISLGPAYKDLYYKTAAGYEKLIVPNNNRSRIYQFTGGEVLELYRQQPDAEGNIQYRKIASTSVRKDLKKVFFVMLPHSKANGPEFLIYHVGDTFKTSDSQKWIVLNFTNRDLVARIESDIKPFSLGPGGTNFVSPKPRDNNSYVFSVAEKIDGRWEKIYDKIWPHRPGKRAIVFLLPSDDPYGMGMKAIFEDIIDAPVENDP